MTGMYSRLNGRFSVKNGRNEVEELIQILIRSLWKCMKEDFYEEFDPELLLSKHVELLKKASAWYVVTYRENMPKFLSFPWINSGFLLDIKYGAILDGLLTVESVILELECMVETALDRVERLPSRKDKDFILAKAKVLLEMWCNCNYFNLTQVLKLFSAAMPSEEYAESISYMFNFFKYIVCLSLQEDLTQTNIVNLSNEAMYSYQRIAVKKDLACFGLSQKYAEIDKVEMDPRIMSQDVIENCDLKYLTNFLHVNSGVDSVDGRLEDGKILISAVGTADKVEKLEDLIREGSASLKNEFRP